MYRAARRMVGVLAVAGLLAAGTACDTEPVEEPTPTPAPPEETPATPPPDDEATEVQVVMIDNELELPTTEFSPGTYRFVAEQHGENPHALSIEGPGVSETTPEVPGGDGTEELTVTLEPGTYELWCPVPGHREDGMEATIEVS